MADLHGHELLHCAERKNYFVWTGCGWRFDDFVEAERRAEDTIVATLAEAKYITEPEKRKAFLKFVNTSMSFNSLRTMIHLAKKKVRQLSAAEFDRDPWALNVANGTVDLRTGELRPHRPEDFSTKLIELRYE